MDHTMPREGQLELFDLNRQSPVPPRRYGWGGVVIHLRQDQLIVLGIGVLIGVTVIFAAGVERGKQLARAERLLLSPTLAKTESASRSSAAPASSPVDPPSLTKSREAAKTGPGEEPKRSPTATPKVTTPRKLAAPGRSRYAIQVATYSRPQLAKQELARLQARGEPAFLVMRNGQMSVYIGPFPSKVNATEKLTTLKTRYRDCFVRAL